MIVDATRLRGARSMPTMSRVASFNHIDGPPHCVRCGWAPGMTDWRSANRYLQRAHVIDRCYGGLDAVQNLRPLCPLCHREQPSFMPGDEMAALAWFYPPGFRIITAWPADEYATDEQIAQREEVSALIKAQRYFRASALIYRYDLHEPVPQWLMERIAESDVDSDAA